MENFGTTEKTMVLRTTLWYYTENYGTSIYEEKNNMINNQKTKKPLFLIVKTMAIYQNN